MELKQSFTGQYPSVSYSEPVIGFKSNSPSTEDPVNYGALIPPDRTSSISICKQKFNPFEPNIISINIYLGSTSSWNHVFGSELPSCPSIYLTPWDKRSFCLLATWMMTTRLKLNGDYKRFSWICHWTILTWSIPCLFIFYFCFKVNMRNNDFN